MQSSKVIPWVELQCRCGESVLVGAHLTAHDGPFGPEADLEPELPAGWWYSGKFSIFGARGPLCPECNKKVP